MPWLAGQAQAQTRASLPVAPGEAVPWPTVTLLGGQRLDAAELHGRAVVVVFFSTSCSYCGRHNQHVEKLVHATAGQPLQVIGAALDREPAVVQSYLQQHGYTFGVTLDHQPLREVLTSRRMIPMTCVIDRSGRLRSVIPGEMFESDVLELARWARA